MNSQPWQYQAAHKHQPNRSEKAERYNYRCPDKQQPKIEKEFKHGYTLLPTD
jgi:hypothetical protein